MKYDLAKLKKVNLRDIWKHEALDFTQWLAMEENLELLGQELGIEINLIQTEADVGSFNVDILAQESISGKKIIIENQLEITNHDHLGKLITYAAGHDANIVIWIVKDIREEHQKAIEWLNNHSDNDIGFFLIRIELWQIGDSKPAPNFETVCSPNEWAKVIKGSSTKDKKITDTQNKYLEFWQGYVEYVQNENLNISLRKPLPQHWFDIAFGTSEAHISLTLSATKDLINCGVYISDNKNLYDYLYSKKDEIQKEMGLELNWTQASKASRIFFNQKANNLFDKTTQDKKFEWLFNNYLLFKKTFSKHIKNFK